jgi:hypothetical protein
LLLILDNWSRVKQPDLVLQHPTWADVTRSISRLDARKHSLLSLAIDDDNHLLMGGDGKRFVVTVTERGNRFFVLVNRGGVYTTTIPLTIDGEEDSYPVDQVVGENAAIACALTYFRSQKRDEHFEWRECADKKPRS